MITIRTRREEVLNSITHGIGFLFSIFMTVLLILKALTFGTISSLISYSIFGSAMCVLYASSMIYHGVQNLEIKKKIQIYDHVSIYLLIAGTYIPFTQEIIGGNLGLFFSTSIILLAFLGIIVKLFYYNKFRRLSTYSYLLLGWIGLVGIKFVWGKLDPMALLYLFLGGFLYSIGTIFYALKKKEFFHTIWHLFVMAGSFCHSIVIYYYV